MQTGVTRQLAVRAPRRLCTLATAPPSGYGRLDPTVKALDAYLRGRPT
jgi:hypothetical protein